MHDWYWESINITQRYKITSVKLRNEPVGNIYSHDHINLFEQELLLYSNKKRAIAVTQQTLQMHILQAIIAIPNSPICLKPCLDLCLIAGIVLRPPRSVKGEADRQTYEQPAFISLRETWQQRAQLPGHVRTNPSVFPPFYLSCHQPTMLRRRHGGIERCD